MSHKVPASDAVAVPEPEFGKKSLTHFVLAVECRVAEMITHAAATANTATIAMMCNVT
jgi:hypothetical protein